MTSLQKIEVLDKRLAVNNTRKYAVLRGPEQYIWQTFNSSSFSNSNATIQNDPPSKEHIVCPVVYLETDFTVDLAGVATVSPNLLAVDGNGNISAFDGPRAKALYKIIANLRETVMNYTFTTNLNEYVEIFDRVQNTPELSDWTDYSGQPNMPDYAQSWALTDHTNRDPFGTYYDNPTWCTRASFPMQILSNTPTSAKVRFTLAAPLPLSPFAFGDQTRSGFYGVDKMKTALDWGDLTRIWSHSPAGNTLNSVTVNVNAVATRLGFISPPEKIARQLTYEMDLPYYLPDLYTTNMNVVAPHATTTVNMNAVQLGNIPNKLYLYARTQDADRNFLTPDVYFNISNISLNYNGQAGLLSSLSERDLHIISQKNGYAGSFDEWHSKWGSLLILMFGEDIPLAPFADSKAPGLEMKTNFQLKCTVTNISDVPIIPQLNALFIEEGYTTIRNGVVDAKVGFLTQEDVYNAEPSNLTFSAAHHVLGGFSWSGLFNTAKRLIGKVASNPHVQSFAQKGLQKGFEYLGNMKASGGRFISRSELLQ